MPAFYFVGPGVCKDKDSFHRVTSHTHTHKNRPNAGDLQLLKCSETNWNFLIEKTKQAGQVI